MTASVKVDYMCHLDRESLDKAQHLFGEDEATRRQLVQELREWIKEQPYLHSKTDEHYLTLFIRGCKYDLEKAKGKIEANLTIRSSLPQIFTGWDPLKPNIQAVLSKGMCLPLPGYDDEYRKVIIMRPANYNPHEMQKDDVEKANSMIIELFGHNHEQYCIQKTILIYDWQGFSLSHLSPQYLWASQKITRYYQMGSPMRVQLAIHVRTSRIVGQFIRLIKTMLNNKMQQRIHDVGTDFKTLKQHIPSRMLPADYGGDGPSLEQLTNYWKKQCEDNRQWLEDQEQYKADESKRPAGTKSGWFGFY